MEYNLENIFSTPISISDYDLRTLDAELTECLDSLNFSSNPDFDKCNTKTSGSVITSNVIEEYGLNHLKGCIMNSLKLYSHRVVGHSNFNFAIASSWFTKTQPKHHIQVHHHQLPFISGVYYHSVPKDSGDIYFRSIDKMKQLSPFYQESQDYYVESKKGSLILFPSWIDHGVRSNNSSEDRISISFNVII